MSGSYVIYAGYFHTRQVILFQGDDGYIIAECPSLPGCISQGRTMEEAVDNIREAILIYIETLIDYNQPIPNETFQTMVIVV
jgi:predicted RNase H-like HicB family nuclease